MTVVDEVERPQWPVLQKEWLVLLCQILELLQRLTLVTLIHLDVVCLSPLFSRLQVNLSCLSAFCSVSKESGQIQGMK